MAMESVFLNNGNDLVMDVVMDDGDEGEEHSSPEWMNNIAMVHCGGVDDHQLW